jgi:hypothetical protein
VPVGAVFSVPGGVHTARRTTFGWTRLKASRKYRAGRSQERSALPRDARHRAPSRMHVARLEAPFLPHSEAHHAMSGLRVRYRARRDRGGIVQALFLPLAIASNMPAKAQHTAAPIDDGSGRVKWMPSEPERAARTPWGIAPKCRSRMPCGSSPPVRKRHADNARVGSADRVVEAPFLATLATETTMSESCVLECAALGRSARRISAVGGIHLDGVAGS